MERNEIFHVKLPERDNSKPEECNPYRQTLKTPFKISELERVIIHGSSRDALNFITVMLISS